MACDDCNDTGYVWVSPENCEPCDKCDISSNVTPILVGKSIAKKRKYREALDRICKAAKKLDW